MVSSLCTSFFENCNCHSKFYILIYTLIYFVKYHLRYSRIPLRLYKPHPTLLRLKRPQELKPLIRLPKQFSPIIQLPFFGIRSRQHNQIHRPIKVSKYPQTPNRTTTYAPQQLIKKSTYLKAFSSTIPAVPGSGNTPSLISTLAPGFSAGISARKILIAYLSDQLCMHQRMKYTSACTSCSVKKSWTWKETRDLRDSGMAAMFSGVTMEGSSCTMSLSWGNAEAMAKAA